VMSAKFYPSLTKPIMISGIERKPAGVVIGSGLGMLALAWQLFSVVCLVMGVLLLTVGLYVLRSFAKRDPMMIEVYRRFVMYPKYLPARSTPFRSGR
jgi:type IV secretory pathway TrbD component